jgi:hypothetical protein
MVPVSPATGHSRVRAVHSADHEPSCVPRVPSCMHRLVLMCFFGLCVLMGAQAATCARPHYRHGGEYPELGDRRLLHGHGRQFHELPQHGVVSTRPQLMVDLKTGHFEGEIECEGIRNAHGRWVDHPRGGRLLPVHGLSRDDRACSLCHAHRPGHGRLAAEPLPLEERRTW